MRPVLESFTGKKIIRTVKKIQRFNCSHCHEAEIIVLKKFNETTLK